MRALRSVWLLCLCSVSIAVAQPAYKPAAARTLLRAEHVIDVHTGKEAAGETIVVEGDRITAIAPTASTTARPDDPLADIKLLQHVPFVMKAGVVYKNEAHPDAVDKLPAATAALGPTRPQPRDDYQVNSF